MPKSYEQYLKEAGNVHLAYYLQAADLLNIKYSVLVPGLLAKFENENKHWFIINTVTPLTNTPSTTIAKRKNLTNKVLTSFNIPVPIQVPLKDEKDAINFFKEYKDIVIKPSQQLGGIGVTLLPKSNKQVEKAFEYAFQKSMGKGINKVIGEEFIKGDNYRLLVLGNRVIGIVRRKSAFVIGDGKNSIKELIRIKNKERKKNLLKPISIDNEVVQRLDSLGVDFGYIPKKGEEITLRYNCNLTTGGTTQECSSQTHQYYKDLAINAVKCIGANFGGVDVITPDITKPAKCVINEINYNPGLRLHYKVQEGEIVKVAVPILEYISKFI